MRRFRQLAPIASRFVCQDVAIRCWPVGEGVTIEEAVSALHGLSIGIDGATSNPAGFLIGDIDGAVRPARRQKGREQSDQRQVFWHDNLVRPTLRSARAGLLSGDQGSFVAI